LEELHQLIKDCANQNRLAQEKLYKKFYPALFLLCKRFFPNNHEALECLNDGMLKVFTKIGFFRHEKGEFFNWVYTIVRNTVLDKLKLNPQLPFIEINERIENSIEGSPFEALEWKDIYTLLDVLPPATRVVCVLYYMEGFPIKEISEILKLSAGTIKWHLSETRIRLKSIMKNHYC